MRFFTLIAIIILCLSIESGLPGPNGSNGIFRFVVGFTLPPVPIGQIHSKDP